METGPTLHVSKSNESTILPFLTIFSDKAQIKIVESSDNVDTLEFNNKKFDNFIDIVFQISHSSSDLLNTESATAEIKTAIEQALELSVLVSNKSNDVKKQLMPALHKINKHLEALVYWINNKLSAVDLVYFVVLSPLVKTWSTSDTHTFDNISRWYDNIQHNDKLFQVVNDKGMLVNFVLDVPKPVAQVKQAQPKEKKQPQPKETVVQTKVEDLVRCEFRVGKIVDVKKHPDASKLYIETIDIGNGKQITVVSGLVDYIPIEQMRDQFVVLLCNLKPSKLKGVTSEAMVIVAQSIVSEDKELLQLPDGTVAGDSIYFGEVRPEGKPDAKIDLSNSKNIFKTLQVDLKTDDNLQVNWKGIPMKTDKGLIKSKTIKGANLG